MTFYALVFRNVVRQKLRSALTAAGVAVAIATVVTLVGVSRGLTQTVMESFRGFDVDLVVVRAGAVQRMSSSLSERLGERLAKMPEAAVVIPALTDMVSLEGTGPVGVPIHGWPLDSPVWNTLRIVRGRALQEGDRQAVVIGESLAHDLDKRVGDALEIELRAFRIVGIYDSANIYERGAAAVLLPDLQQLMDRVGQVSEFMISVKPDLPDPNAAASSLRRRIDAMSDDDGRPLGLTALPTEQYVTNNMELRLARDMAWAISSIALLIGSVSVLNNTLMSVLERTQEIGVLRAIGWRKQRIVKMIVCESCLLSVAGALFGIVASVLLIAALSRHPAARGLVRGETPPALMAAGLLIAALVGVLGAVYPAFRGAGLQPTEALRYE